MAPIVVASLQLSFVATCDHQQLHHHVALYLHMNMFEQPSENADFFFNLTKKHHFFAIKTVKYLLDIWLKLKCFSKLHTYVFTY